jgi:hypothetical protein
MGDTGKGPSIAARALRDQAICEASLLSAAGLRLEEIADVLGHSSTRMTGDVYRHAVLLAVSAGVRSMEQLLTPNEPANVRQSPCGMAEVRVLEVSRTTQP